MLFTFLKSMSPGTIQLSGSEFLSRYMPTIGKTEGHF